MAGWTLRLRSGQAVEGSKGKEKDRRTITQRHRGGAETMGSSETESALRSQVEQRGLVRMRRSEIERMEAVGGEFSSLIRLWESVEKSKTPRSKKKRGLGTRVIRWRGGAICVAAYGRLQSSGGLQLPARLAHDAMQRSFARKRFVG